MSEYRVSLDVYTGPLDLLLHLIRKEEVDIWDIPIARITDQYLKHIEMLKSLDLNMAGEFLVMAATLMHIKSKMLLPSTGEEEEEEDPRMELVHQLLEYRRFKEAALELQRCAERQSQRLPAAAHPEEIEPEPSKEIEEVSAWDLLEAFERLVRQTGAVKPHQVTRRDLPVDIYIERLLSVLNVRKRICFSEIFRERKEKIHMIGTFLALLELVHRGKIRAHQEQDFGDIYIELLEEEAGSSGELNNPPLETQQGQGSDTKIGAGQVREEES